LKSTKIYKKIMGGFHYEETKETERAEDTHNTVITLTLFTVVDRDDTV